jgi:arsenite methyltransferase
MSGLQFTDEAARRLEKAYLTRDVIAQRSDTIRHLKLSPGERVLDIGCGPGFLCESMGEIVGPNGTIVGIDISADLIARCNGRKTSAQLSYEVGDATKLDQPNASFDVVVCTQVAEYVTDVDRVFSEAGFRFDGAAVFPILNLQYDDDSYSWGLAQIVRKFVGGKNDVSAADLDNWHGEFERLSEARRYFFSSNRYIFKASKPPSSAS